MPNHPNRNWRARLQAAADQWLESDEAQEITGGPEASPVKRQERREVARAGYVAGFAAGRASNQRPPRKPD